ncbi:MAG: hypothetical protein IT384_29770 [Deltaproteobacteria bacterium]|nr:hypothetical protein [Deltaproteobacteria bacterium]
MKNVVSRLTLAAMCTAVGSVAACGGEGAAPQISNLTVSTSSITRGTPSDGSVTVHDDDGLGSLRLELMFAGPSPVTTDVAVQGATDAVTEAAVPFAFALTAGAQPGAYTLEVHAIDADGHRSNGLSTSLTVQ